MVDESSQPPQQKYAVVQFLERPIGKVAAVAFVLLCFFAILFGYYYNRYARIIDQKLEEGPFSNTVNIYSAPTLLSIGEPVTADEIIARLRRAGYTESKSNALGWFARSENGIEIHPGPKSYFDEEEEDPALIQVSNDKIARITSLRSGGAKKQYLLEPQFIANLSERNREKRELVRFADLPKVLVNAVVSAEDKRFFEHGGFDSFRIAKAAYVDLKQGRKEQGASTITMQLARNLWLDSAKNWRRKLSETLIAMHLEQRLSKQQIFEYYANDVYLGRRGTFSLHGFGEAAREYFGTDVRRLSLAQAATLAGMIQRPSYFDPSRFPQRVKERRNVVLRLMQQNGYISARECAEAMAEPLKLAPPSNRPVDAPYFMDLLNAELQKQQESHPEVQSVYTTLDLDLQRAAEQAIQIGMAKLDARLAKRARKGRPVTEKPQVALVAIDPHTGAIRALVGGRNYLESQLDRALAKRQPGSVFKPFVYAAAMDTAIDGGKQLFTPASVVDDEPTTFWFNNQPYDPDNFGDAVYGPMTLRRALAKSVNVVTVKVADAVGYSRVASLARRAGLNVQATPSAALGSYEATPIEMAGAYTIFANQGKYVKPAMISLIRDRSATVTYSYQPVTRNVLDPRVSYLMVSMMEEVMRSGTAASARAQGVTVPAAGKTGTSRDGWFAGFTPDLLAVVWVGYDDNRDLDMEGAKSALPIWTEFMKAALKLPAYAQGKKFNQPPGIVTAEIDPDSGEIAGPFCPNPRTEVFIAGTQPTEICTMHSPDNMPGQYHASVAGEFNPAVKVLPVVGAPSAGTTQ